LGVDDRSETFFNILRDTAPTLITLSLRPSFSDILRDVGMGTNYVAKLWQNYLLPCTYCSVVPKRNDLSPCGYMH